MPPFFANLLCHPLPVHLPLPTLLQIVHAATADAYHRGGSHLVCRPGCTQCCIGVFPIAQQDAARLREGLLLLHGTDPQRATNLQHRVNDTLTRLDPWFPGDKHAGTLADDYESAILFEEFANDEPCPVLDPKTGTCDLYAHRPILCRTFGPPALMEGDEGETNLGTCDLCFTQASTEEIAAAQLDPTLAETEASFNEQWNLDHRTGGETLIAYALRTSLL